MPQELVIAVPTEIPVSEEYQEWIKATGEEVAKLLPQFQVTIYISVNESISHNRNSIVHAFLENPDNAWLWQVERDLVWSAQDLVKLIETRRPVIGLLHTACEEWPRWAVTFYEDLVSDEQGVVQVPEVSANGLLVHRSVFEKIKADEQFPLAFRDENSWEPHHAFFQQARVQFKGLSRLLREEHFFQWLCRERAIGIYCHTKVRLKRKGPNGELYPKEGQAPNLVAIPAPNAAEWPIKPIPGQFLICLQWHQKEHDQVQRLYELIKNCRGIKCEWDVMLVEHDPNLKYPDGPNKMAYDLIKTAPDWAKDAKCVLLMEADCVPVAPDWIDQLSEEWDRAAGQGKMVLGHWQRESGGHINGNLMFDPNLANVIDLGDKPPKRPWDIAYPPLFEPYWARTGLIKNLYRWTNVTDEELRTPAVGTKPPVLIHGVRDSSAWDYAKKMMP